jgi:hypothetical protein
MGSQQRASLVTLLRDAEAVDHGILWDGKTPGLAYTGRSVREARAADLTLAVTDLLGEFAPVDDDQNTCNHYTASRTSGGSATVEDVTGPLGTAEIGLYADSGTFNCQVDESLRHFAGWAVGQGTIAGYRWPRLSFDVTPARADAVLGLIPGARVDVTGLAAQRATCRPPRSAWPCTAGRCDRLDPLDDRAQRRPVRGVGGRRARGRRRDDRAAGEFPIVLDTDGATLAATADAGATSLSVATTNATSPLWSTTATDYPITLDVGGVPVVASACAGRELAADVHRHRPDPRVRRRTPPSRCGHRPCWRSEQEAHRMGYTAGQTLRASQLGPVPCTSATRPSSPHEGQLIVESDTGMDGDLLRRRRGATWRRPGRSPRSGSGTPRACRPSRTSPRRRWPSPPSRRRRRW